MNDGPTYLTPAQLMAMTGLTKSFLAERRRRGLPPEFVKFGVRTVRYPAPGITAWVEDLQSDAAD